MKRTLLCAILCIVAVVTTGCAGTKKSDLRIYVISRSLINDGMTASETVTAAKTDGRLAFDGEDIEGYNWQTHRVTLIESAVPSLGVVTPERGGSSIFKVDDSYAFVLIIKNKHIYTGGFTAGSKNPDVPLQPSITDTGSYSFAIGFDAKYASGSDPRSDTSLYGFLKDNGLLVSKTD